jgi:hypothetical protein
LRLPLSGIGWENDCGFDPNNFYIHNGHRIEEHLSNKLGEAYSFSQANGLVIEPLRHAHDGNVAARHVRVL